MNYQTDYERMRDRTDMRLFIMWICAAIGILTGVVALEVSAGGSYNHDKVQEVSDVMLDLLSPSPSRWLYREDEKRYEFAKDTVAVTKKHRVPEFLMTVKWFKESSFRTSALAKDRPTYGLGQMHGVAAKGCDMKTRIGQMDCSAKWMRFCFDKCGTWEGALTAYGTSGHCSPTTIKTSAARKFKLWKSINRQIRQWLKYEVQRERIRAEIEDDLEHYADMQQDK